MDYHSWGDDSRSAAYLVSLEFLVANSVVCLELRRETYPEGGLAAYPDASVGGEPCEEMRDKMAKSYSNLVESCCNPFRCCTVVEVEQKRCTRDGESRGAGNHGEETHDATLAVEVEDHHYPEQMIAS